MAFFDKLKTLVGVEDDEFTESYLDEEPIQPKPQSVYGLGEQNRTIGRDRPVWTPPSRSSQPSPLYSDNHVRSIRRERDNVLGQSAGSTLRALTQKFKIVVVEPKHFQDSTKLVDNLKSHKPVIINLEKVETDTARKIFDFLSGATYALSGNVQKIANNIFVFLPDNVDVTTNAEQEGSGFAASDGNPWQR
ncbi:MAG: cell division protein SepF [Clostridiales Family XIII bacterium]|jgi:FtsZ-interacting cell division protein YlmF|nr:cell division protein SepF [Clostridiales Family XIII bacterium]